MLRPSAYITILPDFSGASAIPIDVRCGSGFVIILGNCNEPARAAEGTACQAVHVRCHPNHASTLSGRLLNGVKV